MPDEEPPGWDEIRALIEHVDEVCRQAEHIRHRTQQKQSPFWPDKRRNISSDIDGTSSDRRHQT